MKLEELLKVLHNPYRLRIIKDGKDLYVGYLANLHHNDAGITGQEEVEHFGVVPEIRHKQWKNRDLMPPLEPDVLTQYSFADLEMKLYYTVYLK